MMTHTPGPWHLDTKTAVESYFDDVNVLRDDGLAVAVALHNGNIAPEETMANGKLIAAAPVMLAALKHAAQNMPHPDQMIDDAIALAEG